MRPRDPENVVVLPLSDHLLVALISSKLHKPPAYRLRKPSGQAVVRINGHDYYLGRHGTTASQEAYRRLIAEWATSLRPASTPFPRAAIGIGLTINELMVAYWDPHVVVYYTKNGRPTSEVDNIRQALRFLRRLFGSSPAEEFGPQNLKTVRQAMIEAGRCRNLINKDINRIKGMFRWAVEHELLFVTIYQTLQAVAGLRKGRSEARETEPVGPVLVEHVRSTLPFLSPQVAAIVEQQLVTGARPGEITSLRPRDITVGTGGVWVYRPQEHKTEHHGRERLIMLGPRAQAVLRLWLDRDLDAYCFSPAEVLAARSARQGTDGNRRASPPKPGKKASARPKPGGHYTKDSYRVAIQRACRRAGVPPWAPNQLRHTRATEIREKYGIEAAQVVLGHSDPNVTAIYAERSQSKAQQIASEIG